MSRTITVNLPPKDQLEARATSLLAAVEAMEIDGDSMMEVAAEELVSLKSGYKKLEEARVSHVKPLNDEVKHINNWFRDSIAKMEQAEAALKRKMLNYQREREQRCIAEQARIEAAQRKERTRLAAKDEADPEQRAANELVALVMTPHVTVVPPKLAGVSTKSTYKGRVTDLFALVQYVAKHPEFLYLLQPDATAINQIAKAQRDACRIEGILVYEDKILTTRSA